MFLHQFDDDQSKVKVLDEEREQDRKTEEKFINIYTPWINKKCNLDRIFTNESQKTTL